MDTFIKSEAAAVWRKNVKKISTDSNKQNEYQEILLGAFKEDSTLFVSEEEQLASWRLLSPLLDDSKNVADYNAGSWVPASADQMLEGSSHFWKLLDN